MALSKPSIPDTPQHFLECGIEDCERNCEFYCNPCNQNLCKQCTDEHLRSPETKNHEVVLYQLRKRQLPVKKCKIHTTKDIDLLCNECKVALCSKCTTTEDHWGHRFIDLETIYAEKFALCQEEISKVQEYFLPTSQDLQKEIKEDATEIKVIMDNLRTSMKADGESLKSLVDTVISENMEKLNKTEQSLLEKLKSQGKTFDEYIAYLSNLVKEFHGYLSSPDLMNLITILPEKNLNIQPIPETKKLRTPVISTGQYSKEDVVQLLGKINDANIEEEMRKIKRMKIQSSTALVKFTNEQSKPGRHKKSVLKQTLSLSSSVTKIRGFQVQISSTSHLSLDQSGRFWVSDWNGNLVQTDLQGNQLQKIKTSIGFGYHSVTEDGELIFTNGNKKVINRITSDNNITEFTKTGNWTPISIHSSHINGDILVGMTKSEKTKVTRYNKIGKKLQNIQRGNKGQELYGRPHYISENINGDICASDFKKKALVVVNKSGQHRFSYEGQESVFFPYGICTDVLGHILVTDSLNVHLLDQDGQFLSLLLNPKVSNSISVCVDDENSLFLGQNRNNTVTVYKYLQ